MYVYIYIFVCFFLFGFFLFCLETHLSGEFPPPTGRESRVQAAPPPNPTTLGEGHTESG